MALNSSGPISLGGSTTGQSVNLELGQSATTTISFNDANVRTLTGTTAGTALSMPSGFWGKSSGPPFFISTYTNTGSKLYGNSITYDSSNNIYVTSGGVYGDTKLPAVFKYTQAGNYAANLQWSYSTFDLTSSSVAVDSTNGVVYASQNQTNGQSGYCSLGTSSLALSSAKFISRAGTSIAKAAVDSAQNLIILTTDYGNSTSGSTVYKYNSSGTLVWQKKFTGTTVPYFMSLCLDSSDNIYMGGYTSVSPINGLVAKLDSSGTVLWAQSATTSAISSLKFASIAVSSAGYVFVGSTGPGTATATDPRMGAIFSFTTSGTYSASTGFATTVTAKTPGGPVSLTTDSSGVYVCESPFSSNFNCTLLKLNNSLVTQWANKLTQSAGGYSTGAVTLFSNKNVPAGGLLVSGACYGPASGTNALVTMCVPSDGSHSGSTPLSVGSYTFFYEPDTSITQVTLPGVTTASFSLTAATASDTISSITVSQTVLSGTANGPTTV